MDQAIRNKLRSVVTQCRKLLEESIAHQLQGKYDIYATGKKDEVKAEDDVPLGHLNDEERQAREDILAHFKHIEALGYKPKESLEQLIREIAFTHLNRLCAYKMMEVRDVYVGGQRFREAVSKSLKSQGFLFYLADHPEEEKRYNAGDQERAYQHFLNWLGGTLSQEIGVLFSPTDPANRVYPPQRVLDELLDLLNSEELKGIWSEDEAIGWIYQYFTPKELRDQARKESQAPRNSYELAFRNQFFTPRYVVEFLTDNTLGRIWYEMRKGRTRLVEHCRYLIHQPDEVFFSQSTSPEEEYPQNGCIEAARLLREGDEETFPPFRTSDESVQRMIELAHTVSAYERHGDDAFKLWNSEDGPKKAERMAELSTQEILDLLFMICRADRHGGRGEVYAEPWFAALAGEVRRRAIAAMNPDVKVEEQLRLPVFIPYRAKKDPRELKILDPACGSGHFLLYCFGLLLVIYEEAYDDHDLGPGLQADYPTRDDMRRALPGLILRHNLHGIDIDLRCTQIAALALWLRCQRAYQEMGLKKDRPRITRSNIVCAEPMPGEKELLDEFLKTLREDRLEALIRQVMKVADGARVRATRAMADGLSDLVRTVWEKMRMAGEAGSLLRIEDRLQDAIRRGQDEWEERLPLFRFTEFSLSEQPKERLVRFVPGDIVGERTTFWDKAEVLVQRALDDFVEYASNEGRFQRCLFVEDAQHGLGFVDLSKQRYDVALMNPPFGEEPTPTKGYIERTYPRTCNDLYAAFVEQGISLLQRNGLLGAITSRTGFFLSSFQKWREQILLHNAKPTVFGDLGYGVLDTAMVETAAYCIRAEQGEARTTFVRLLQAEDKAIALRTAVAACNIGDSATDVFSVASGSFEKVPTTPFVYWVSERIRSLFKSLPAFQNNERRLRLGDHPSDDFRYLRLWWEVDPVQTDREWVTYYKGGSNVPFYGESFLVVDWDSVRQTYRGFFGRPGRSSARPSNYQFFFLPGLTVPNRPHKRGHFSHVPPGGVFGHTSPVVQLPQRDHWASLGLLNSNAYIGLLHLLMPRGVSSGQTLKYETGYLASVPLPPIEGTEKDLLEEAAIAGFNLVRSASRIEESSRLFGAPIPVMAGKTSIEQALESWQEEIAEAQQAISSNQERINDCAFRLYGIDGEDRTTVEAGLSELRMLEGPAINPESVDETSSLSKTKNEMIAELLSYALGCAFGRWDIRIGSGEIPVPDYPDPFSPLPPAPLGTLRVDERLRRSQFGTYPLRIDGDGILVDDPDHADDIIRRVRDVLEVIWKERADAIEREACEIPGVADLRDYFRKPGAGGFWDDHIKRYSKSRRKAPIYWLLQSSKKNYALWIYYHRLDKDILFKALLNYVEPKIRREESRLAESRSQKSALGPAAKGAKKLDKDIDRQEAFLSELRDFEEKLRRAANLHLEPDLNDGVVLNIAPLRELVPWKEAKSYWDDLMDGKYEWSSIGKQLREKGLVK
jgi:hypothetical protein